jgi:hypothetical protein
MALTRPIAEAKRKRVRKADDFHAWVLEQARSLRSLEGNVCAPRLRELAEELKGMARSDERAVESLMENLLTHLLKWRYQPQRQTRSWRVSVESARSDVRNLLADSPSLKTKMATLLTRAYEKARRSAGAEMDVDERLWSEQSPCACPWTSSSCPAASDPTQSPASRRAGKDQAHPSIADI